MTSELPSRDRAPATRASAEYRRLLLAHAIAMHIAHGARLESQSDYEAVLARGLRLHKNHGLTISGGEKRSTVSVDEYGNVAVRKR